MASGSRRIARSMSPIVFAGYGITAKDDALKLDYDDYAGIDVKGKAVLLIRREPQQADDASPFDGKRTTPIRHLSAQGDQRVSARCRRGPLGQRPGGPGERKRRSCSLLNGGGIDANSNLPFVMLTRDFADKLLTAAGEPSLAQLEKADRPGPEALAPGSSRAGPSARRSRSSGTGSRPRTWSAFWKGPDRMPTRLS